jgi:hypothetical protein
VPDINEPFPDRGHEAIRQAVLAAVADIGARADTFYKAVADINGRITALEAQVRALNVRDDANQIRDTTGQTGTDLLQRQVAALTARVAALETPTD